MLVGRTKARKHNRISGTETKNVVELIKNASITFNTIFRSPRMRTQLLVVNASECKIAEVNSQKKTELRNALDIIRSGINPVMASDYKEISNQI